MSDAPQGPGWWAAADGKWYPPQGPPAGGNPPVGYGAASGNFGPIGREEKIGTQILLSIATLGLYGFYWVYKCHEEVRRHSGEGVGGGLGVLIFFFVPFVTLFVLPMEIKRMYERDGRPSPVGAATAFWILLFGVPWYVKCQLALNQYWASKGAGLS